MMRFVVLAAIAVRVLAHNSTYYLTADGGKCEDHVGYERIFDAIVCLEAAALAAPTLSQAYNPAINGGNVPEPGGPFSIAGCVYDSDAAGRNLRLIAVSAGQPAAGFGVAQVCKRTDWISTMCSDVSGFENKYQTKSCDRLTSATQTAYDADGTTRTPCNNFYKVKTDGSYAACYYRPLVDPPTCATAGTGVACSPPSAPPSVPPEPPRG